MKINKKWFSLVIAIWLIIVISLMAYTILEYILPFSRNIKWVENSTKAYYYANSWIEKWLYYISTRKNKNIRKDTKLETSDINNSWTATWYLFTSYSSGTTLPGGWYWDSEFDEAKEWNRVSIWNPIQLSIWYEFLSDASNLKIYIRTPKTDILRPSLKNMNNLWENIWYLSWQLTGWTWALNSNSWSTIKSNDINGNDIKISDEEWENLSWNNKKFSDAFSEFKCNNNSVKCILKLSVINDLQTTGLTWDWPILPYLEWKIKADSNKIPLRYSRIEARGKSYNFARDLSIRVPQETVNQAFDFAVFQ